MWLGRPSAEGDQNMIVIRPGDDVDRASERAAPMKVFIQDIVVKDRFRKDKGDIDGLMKSIKELGLLQPIGVTRDNVLVFGERRLTAAEFVTQIAFPDVP